MGTDSVPRGAQPKKRSRKTARHQRIRDYRADQLADDDHAEALRHMSRRRPGRVQNFGTLRSRSPESHALLLHIASPGARLGRGFFIAKRRPRSTTTKTANFPGLAPPVAVTHRLGRYAAPQVPIIFVKMFENNFCAFFPNVFQFLCVAFFFEK